MSAQNRTLLGLITAQVCLHASLAGVRMAAPLWVLRSGASELALGPVIGLFALAPVALALPAGRLADQRGYHVPLRLAVALTIGGALCAAGATLVSVGSYAALCLAAVLSGSGGNIGMIAIQRTAGRAAAHDPAALRRVFSWLGIAPSLSNVVGPLIAGVLIDQAGFRSAFGFLSLLPVCSLACARLVPREVPRTPVTAARKAAWELLSAPMLRRVLLVSWFMSASWDVHSFVVPVLGNQRGLSASAIGAVIGTFALAVTVVRLLIPLLAHRLSEAHVLTCAMAVAASAFVVYPWAGSVWTMAACASVLGLALGASQPMVMAMLHQITPVHRHGQAIALRSMASNVSSAVMPLAFGALGTTLGASGLFWAMGILVGTGALQARAIHARSAGSPPSATRRV